MYDTRRDLLDAYKATPDVYRSLLEGHTREQVSAVRGGDEGWTIVEVMCHMRDAEERALERTRAMRDQDNPPLPGYDQEAWAVERNYAATSLQDALDAFIRFREQHCAELEALSPQEWSRPGVHEEHGGIDVHAQILHMVAHDLMHGAQIARQLR